MQVPIYQVDAFTNRLFGGNPAAVCPLDDWIADETMQAVAAENNLSETAFPVKREGYYDLRWFTPKAEIDLAGHPTLATAYVIFQVLEPELTEVEFRTQSGPLTVKRDGDRMVMNFPSRPGQPCAVPEALLKGLGLPPKELFRARDYLAVYETEEQVKAMQPRMDLLMQLDCTGIIITAPGNSVDFVSRFFAPRHGIPEDPVTGSAHCTLVPYWSKRLGKQDLTALQVSERVGELFCKDSGDRVEIAGQAVIYMKGEIYV